LSHDGSEDDLRIEDWTPDPIKVVIQDADEFNQWYRNHVVPNTSITGIGIEGVVALFNQYLELNLGKKI
jgi:hypothetical protein